ncbi:hypothetical protein C0J52_00195 [Blattella germanica]|nr:hypothetical protein C0J52_00195 [Blattella germanica]
MTTIPHDLFAKNFFPQKIFSKTIFPYTLFSQNRFPLCIISYIFTDVVLQSYGSNSVLSAYPLSLWLGFNRLPKCKLLKFCFCITMFLFELF